MDKLKSMGEKMMNKEKTKEEGAPADPNKPDYGDKALSSAEKKFGISENRERDEKITDSARGFYEKQTGKKVPEKFSN